MIRKILVPLDGSPLAEAALPFATAIASRTGASLTLIRAAKYRSLLSDVAGDQYRVISTAEQYLAQVTEQLTTQGLEIESGVPFGGTSTDWIVEESETRNVDLVIMATHMREGADRWLHGSVAEAVVHRSHVPVMLVQATDAEKLAQRFSAQRPEKPILIVPLDGSEFAESVLPFAADLAHDIGARVILLGVVPREGQLVAGVGGAITTYAGETHGRLDVVAHTYLASMAANVAPKDVEVETLVRYGEAAHEIIEAVGACAPAAVVMATHSRTAIMRSVLGSVADVIAHHTATPVVMMHPTKIRTAETPTEVSVSQVADAVG